MQSPNEIVRSKYPPVTTAEGATTHWNSVTMEDQIVPFTANLCDINGAT